MDLSEKLKIQQVLEIHSMVLSAVGLQKGYSIAQALKLANLAASHSVTGMGAQGGMPTFSEIAGELDV